jgi:tetratricopeptide (TPR) repeat protein
MLESALAIHRTLGDPANIAAALSTLAMARLEAGDVAGARADLIEALAMFREQGHELNQTIGLCNLGQVALFEGDLEQAQRLLAEGFGLVRRIASPEQEAECELLLGEVALEAGRTDEASARFERSLSICRGSADKRGAANALWRQGAMSLAGGDHATTRALLSEALAEFRQAEMWKELLGCLEDFAVLAHACGQTLVAVRMAAAATAARERLGLIRRPVAEQVWQRRLHALRGVAGDGKLAGAWAEAYDHWEMDDAVRSALALQLLPTAASAA